MDKEKLQELVDKARVVGEEVAEEYERMTPFEQRYSTVGFDKHVKDNENKLRQYQSGEELLEFAQNAVKGLKHPFMYARLLNEILYYLEKEKGGEKMRHEDFIKRIVTQTAMYLAVEKSEVFIVWSCKTLQNSKALISATPKGAPYIEFTMDGDRDVIYMDVYDKREHINLNI